MHHSPPMLGEALKAVFSLKSFSGEGHVIWGSVPFVVNIFTGQASQVIPFGNQKGEKHWRGHFLHIELTKVEIR